MTLSQNEAWRFISVIDERIKKALGRGTVLEITYGDVDNINGRECSVFVAGDTTSSEGFRIPSGMYLESGYRVRVAIDPRGYRYIEEVLAPTYSKVAVDPVSGSVLFGSGDTEPGVIDLYPDEDFVLTVDRPFHAIEGLRVTAPGSAGGQNFEALRIILPNNGYTGFAIYDSPTATQPVMQYAGWGGLLMGPGGSTAPDVSISRTSGGDLSTPNDLQVGNPFAAGGEGIILNASGAIEIVNNASTPYLDFKNSASDDFDARFILQNSGAFELYGVELHSANEDWISPSMTNSWVAYGGSFSAAKYRKDAMGYVHLKGLIKSGTIGSSAFTLPAGYRPGDTHLYAVLSGDATGRLQIDNVGQVIPMSPSVNGWVSLAGVTFKAEA